MGRNRDKVNNAWRHVWGFSDYVINDTGTVKQTSDGSIVQQSRALDGCTTVLLISNSGTPMVKKVCRLVVDSFDWASEGYTPIYHLDGNKSNNHLTNLRRETTDVEVLNRYATDTSYLSQSDVNRLINEQLDAETKEQPPRKRYPQGLHDYRGVRIIETGQEFESKALMCKSMGLDHSTVSKMLTGKGRNRTHHGFTFEYIQDEYKPYVRIVQTGDVYYSVLDMCRALHLDQSNVRKMLKGLTTQKTYRKLSFEWVKREDPSVQGARILRWYDVKDDIPKATNRGVVRPIRIVQTGRVYSTQLECAKEIGGKQTAISRCLRGEAKSHMGYRFEYADAE